jgi:AAA15 family ATPase/GTPase
MAKISKKVKGDIFNVLKTQPNFFGQDNDEMRFLEAIWDLDAMPSQDPRFNDAYGDIHQHIVNNNDWDNDYLFIRRLQLLENDEHFDKFLEVFVHPDFRKDEDDIIKFVLLINPYLEKDGYVLAIKEYNEVGLPIYSIQLKEKIDNLPLDIKQNHIPFFVIKSPSGWSDRISSHTAPDATPSFVLAFNKGWNDFGVRSEFSLFYYNQNSQGVFIGGTKIIRNDEGVNTAEVLPDTFTILTEDFCSLGQSFDYYTNLRQQLKKDFESVLYALRDAAFFPEIQERFENFGNFKSSLIRNDSAERLLRELKYRLYGYDLSNLYKFTYSFQPPFAEEPIEVQFNFDDDKDLPNRIYALIGKNGTGKTQLITSLPLKISTKKNEFFSPKAPLFSKVIAVSYSIFDRFEIPKKTASFNYVYCGLRNEKGELIDEKGLAARFYETSRKIEALARTNQWRRILSNFIEDGIIDEFIVPKEDANPSRDVYKFNIEGYNKIRNRFSSGQSIILYIVSEIVANIRLDSLLLYDEPETHLHPNAITQLMNTIYELVNEFESYCLIATHSPLVIRELFSRNVYVVERHENFPSVRRIGLESFGENLSTLTEEVFGNKDVPKQYKKIIDELVEHGHSFEQILEIIEFDQLPLSLNTRLYIKSLVRTQNEKP